MFRALTSFLFILYVFLGSSAVKLPRYVLKYSQVECVVEPTVITHYSCRIEPSDPSRFTFEFTFAYDLTVYAFHMVVSVPRPPLNSNMKLVDLEVDVCKFFSSNKQNSLVYSIYGAMLENTNQNPQCPVRQGLLYYRNVSVLEYLPAFMPETKFTVQVHFYIPGKISTINLTVKGEVTQRMRTTNLKSGS